MKIDESTATTMEWHFKRCSNHTDSTFSIAPNDYIRAERRKKKIEIKSPYKIWMEKGVVTLRTYTHSLAILDSITVDTWAHCISFSTLNWAPMPECKSTFSPLHMVRCFLLNIWIMWANAERVVPRLVTREATKCKCLHRFDAENTGQTFDVKRNFVVYSIMLVYTYASVRQPNELPARLSVSTSFISNDMDKTGKDDEPMTCARYAMMSRVKNIQWNRKFWTSSNGRHAHERVGAFFFSFFSFADSISVRRRDTLKVKTNSHDYRSQSMTKVDAMRPKAFINSFFMVDDGYYY